MLQVSAQDHSQTSPRFEAVNSPRADIHALIVCPRCRSDIDPIELKCIRQSCKYHFEGFPAVAGQPVLIDFDNSIFPRENYEGEDAGSSVIKRDAHGRFVHRVIERMVSGRNKVALAKSREICSLAREISPAPRILVIGGGATGSGIEPLYEDPSITVVGTDVYASENTSFVCDGHHLPFKNEAFDGVWIQAVLEHVLEPQAVADEIFRVLKPNGLVFADSPFMQQVHEGAYDFTRFTKSGHRWLFRRFDQIDAGVSVGAGVALTWSIRYFVRSLGAGNKIATLASLPFFWFRFLTSDSHRRSNADAASGVYFFGRKSNMTLSPQDMVGYYAKC